MSAALSSDIINITESPKSIPGDHNCNPNHRKLHPNKLHKFHKFINSTFNKFQMSSPLVSSPPKLQERASTSSSISTQSTQIFERSIISSGIMSPETPQHYNLENFSSPILDTTTELISDPKVNYNHIKLNCYDDEQEQEVLEDVYTPRSRSRSIISNSLMNCLNCKNDKISRTNSQKDLNQEYDENLNEEEEDKQKEEDGDKEDVTIDFYSFADILYCETNGRERKGSCYTISAKDYIGIS